MPGSRTTPSRIAGPATSAKKTTDVSWDEPFEAGEAVEAFYDEEEKWYTGIIQKENSDGTFTLLWDEDGEEYTLPEGNMKKICPRKTFDDLAVGQKVKGSVSVVRDFGAFVDIGAIKDGLVHVSNMKPVERKSESLFDVGERVLGFYQEEEDWYLATVDKINKDGTFTIIWDDDGDVPYKVEAKNLKLEIPRMPIKAGDTADFWITKVDRQKGQVGLSMWEGGTRPPADLSAFEFMDSTEFIDGEISAIIDGVGFIVSVQAPDGTPGRGLCHITQIREGFVDNIYDEGEIGQAVRVRVVDVDPERERIRLSMKPSW